MIIFHSYFYKKLQHFFSEILCFTYISQGRSNLECFNDHQQSQTDSCKDCKCLFGGMKIINFHRLLRCFICLVRRLSNQIGMFKFRVNKDG